MGLGHHVVLVAPYLTSCEQALAGDGGEGHGIHHLKRTNQGIWRAIEAAAGHTT